MAAFHSWLTLHPPPITTANTPLSTAAKSLFVGIRLWHHDTQIFPADIYPLLHCQGRSRSPGVCQGSGAVSVFHSGPSGFTLLRQRGRKRLKPVFTFCGVAAKDDELIDLTGDPSLPALLPAASRWRCKAGRN